MVCDEEGDKYHCIVCGKDTDTLPVIARDVYRRQSLREVVGSFDKYLEKRVGLAVL